MKRVVCDIETDGLNPTKIWFIVCRDVDTNKIDIFSRPDLDEAKFWLYTKTVGMWIGHNFILYDLEKVIRKFFEFIKIDNESVIDTLVLSRLFGKNLDSHSLESWGERLGIKKLSITDWDQGSTDEMLSRCLIDTEINAKLFKLFESRLNDPRFSDVIRTEHEMQFICGEMSKNGFGFNKAKANRLFNEIDSSLKKLDSEILEAFPTETLVEEFIPKTNNSKYGYKKGEVFKRIIEVPFNPGSPKQIVEKLNEAGWSPKNKTKGHIKAERALKQCRFKKGSEERLELEERLEDFKKYGWVIDEENLSTLPDSAPSGAKKLAERITLASRQRTLTEWFEAYNNETRSIHGKFLSIGSWTHRMAHREPNMGNIPSSPDVVDKQNPTPVEKLKLEYNLDMRSCFEARPGRRLVGVDADGIQLRILAHYMGDKEFIDALVKGKKEDHTDAHSLNALKLGIGLEHRNIAKTFIYAWILGAGTDKIAEILNCDKKKAIWSQESFLEGYPGLRNLKESVIPSIAKKGYFIGLDGRIVSVPSEHKVLAGLLQSGEQAIMKKATIIWRNKLKELGIRYWLVNFVHDEWQTETLDNDEDANLVESIQCLSIEETGKLLGMNCPLLGTGGSQGHNWAETH